MIESQQHKASDVCGMISKPALTTSSKGAACWLGEIQEVSFDWLTEWPHPLAGWHCDWPVQFCDERCLWIFHCGNVELQICTAGTAFRLCHHHKLVYIAYKLSLTTIMLYETLIGKCVCGIYSFMLLGLPWSLSWSSNCHFLTRKPLRSIPPQKIAYTMAIS